MYYLCLNSRLNMELPKRKGVLLCLQLVILMSWSTAVASGGKCCARADGANSYFTAVLHACSPCYSNPACDLAIYI